jgi:hypothetical protein
VLLAAAIILRITDCPSWFDPFFTTKTAHKLLAARRAGLHNFDFEWFILALKFFDRVPFLDNAPSAKNFPLCRVIHWIHPLSEPPYRSKPYFRPGEEGRAFIFFTSRAIPSISSTSTSITDAVRS